VKVGVRYKTAWRYAAPLQLSTHEIRLFPRGDVFTRILRLKFQTNDKATVRFGRDVFDNCVATCLYPEPAAEFRCELEFDLELTRKSPFDFSLTNDALALPFAYARSLRKVLAPFQEARLTKPLEIHCWTRPQTNAPQPTVATLVALNERLHECIGYERREEGPPRLPEETLRLGQGGCRDVALLLTAALRQCGLAARLTSGFLREADADSRRAEGSLHTWAEVYLPGAGWVGMDATNGIFCNHNCIAAAVGIEPADVTPIDGNFSQPPAAHVTSSLKLVNL
jgi:transglutaminase-like putative cysteine protease